MFQSNSRPVFGSPFRRVRRRQPWITPSIFEWTNNTNVLDEYTLGQLVDNKLALDMLSSHWDTWITEADFETIAAAGLTHVRCVARPSLPPIPSVR
jgi:glucan 1,3-beta-glucosidase